MTVTWHNVKHLPGALIIAGVFDSQPWCSHILGPAEPRWPEQPVKWILSLSCRNRRTLCSALRRSPCMWAWAPWSWKEKQTEPLFWQQSVNVCRTRPTRCASAAAPRYAQAGAPRRCPVGRTSPKRPPDGEPGPCNGAHFQLPAPKWWQEARPCLCSAKKAKVHTSFLSLGKRCCVQCTCTVVNGSLLLLCKAFLGEPRTRTEKISKYRGSEIHLS